MNLIQPNSLHKSMVIKVYFWIGLLMLMPSCTLLPQKTYSSTEQWDLARTRTVEMRGQLHFSIEFDEPIHTGRDIFFTATLTNVSDTALTIRIPNQTGVLEILDPSIIIYFEVEPMDNIEIIYFREGMLVQMDSPMIARDDLITLPPATSTEVRLQLPHIVAATGKDAFALPPGDYLIHMTYRNRYIGYEIEKGNEFKVVDMNAWVGEVEAPPVQITIEP